MFIGKVKGENKNLFSKYFPKKYLVVRRTTRSQILVVLTQFLGVEYTRTREFCYPGVCVFFFVFFSFVFFRGGGGGRRGVGLV